MSCHRMDQENGIFTEAIHVNVTNVKTPTTPTCEIIALDDATMEVDR